MYHVLAFAADATPVKKDESTDSKDSAKPEAKSEAGSSDATSVASSSVTSAGAVGSKDAGQVDPTGAKRKSLEDTAKMVSEMKQDPQQKKTQDVKKGYIIN